MIKRTFRVIFKCMAKTAIVSLMMLTASSSLSSNNSLFSSSKDKRMVCSTSAAAICENANYNGDKFNEDLLASIKENNSGDGRSHIANPTVGAGIVEYTVVGAAIILYTGLLIFDHNLS